MPPGEGAGEGEGEDKEEGESEGEASLGGGTILSLFAGVTPNKERTRYVTEWFLPYFIMENGGFK